MKNQIMAKIEIPLTLIQSKKITLEDRVKRGIFYSFVALESIFKN